MNGIVVLNLYHVWHLDLSKPKTISGEPYATLGPTKCAGDHNRYTAYYIYTCIYTYMYPGSPYPDGSLSTQAGHDPSPRPPQPTPQPTPQPRTTAP